MGEVIRNIAEIKIADDKFRIEENESVPKSVNYVIHIQNERFRMEMTKGEFLHICYGLLFAGQQLEKVKKSVFSNKKDKKGGIVIKSVTPLEFVVVFDWLNKENINYILLCDRFEEETGSQYKKGAPLLVKSEHMDHLAELLEAKGFTKRTHPYGKSAGYELAYNLHDFQTWVNNGMGVCLEIYREMCCMSLTPKTWMPLSKEINREAWEYRIWDGNLHCWKLDLLMEELFLIVKCVFNLHGFQDEYIEEIEKRKEVIYQERFHRYLESVFWGFSDEVITAIENKKYKDIFHKYITYTNY